VQSVPIGVAVLQQRFVGQADHLGLLGPSHGLGSGAAKITVKDGQLSQGVLFQFGE
jgi:hypothetical protein